MIKIQEIGPPEESKNKIGNNKLSENTDRTFEVDSKKGNKKDKKKALDADFADATA